MAAMSRASSRLGSAICGEFTSAKRRVSISTFARLPYLQGRHFTVSTRARGVLEEIRPEGAGGMPFPSAGNIRNYASWNANGLSWDAKDKQPEGDKQRGGSDGVAGADGASMKIRGTSKGHNGGDQGAGGARADSGEKESRSIQAVVRETLEKAPIGGRKILVKPVQKETSVAFKDYDPEPDLSGTSVEGLILLLAKDTLSLPMLRHHLRDDERYKNLAILINQRMRRREVITNMFRLLAYQQTSEFLNNIHNSSRVSFLEMLENIPEATIGDFLWTGEQEVPPGDTNLQHLAKTLKIEPPAVIALLSLRTEHSEGLKDLNEQVHGLSILDALDCGAFYNRLWLDKAARKGNCSTFLDGHGEVDLELPSDITPDCTDPSNSLPGGTHDQVHHELEILKPKTDNDPVGNFKVSIPINDCQPSDFCRLVLHILLFESFNKPDLDLREFTGRIVQAVLAGTVRERYRSGTLKKDLGIVFPGLASAKKRSNVPFYIQEFSFSRFVDRRIAELGANGDEKVQKYLRIVKSHIAKERKTKKKEFIADLQDDGEVISKKAVVGLFEKLMPHLGLKKQGKVAFKKTLSKLTESVSEDNAQAEHNENEKTKKPRGRPKKQ